MALDTFGKRLKLLRVDRSLSQIELRDQMEKLCGVSIGETYVSELERTSKMPSLEVAAAMAKVLDVSLDYLGLLSHEATSYKHMPPVNYMSPEADEMAQLVDSMHPSQREVLLSVAKNMIVAPRPRQMERAEMRDILDSIERQIDRPVRIKVEKILRDSGLPIDANS